MKQLYIFPVIFFIICGLFSVNAQDIIILRDGNMIEAKVMEIHPTEVRYKRIDNLNGPMIIILKSSVLSIKYENGILDIINPSSPAGHETGQANITGSYDSQQSVTSTPSAATPGIITPGIITPLQTILNALPAISVAGNNLKFQFGGYKWVATVNGENFSAGIIEFKDTDDGAILTLKQTHIWPGAMGKTAGRVANRIPGGSAVGGALGTAGKIAGVAGAIEASGPEIILEYKAGPPAKLSFVKSFATAAAPSDKKAAADKQTMGAHPLIAENRFDLNGFNAFAISYHGMPTYWLSYGGGATITIFEKYKPGVFFIPSYFLSFRYILTERGEFYSDAPTLGTGVLFKHRFPGSRVLWNLGTSLDFLWAYGSSNYNNNYYFSGSSFLLGLGIQTGFSFRFNPYTSLESNGLLKFPFGTVNMKPEYTGYYSDKKDIALPESRTIWPFAGGFELGLTFWFPYRSRR